MSKQLRVAAENLSSGLQWLSEEASHYVCRVHRRPLGDALTLFDAEQGLEAPAVLVAVERTRAQVEVGAVRPAAQSGMPWLTLVQGLSKGEKMERIVREATTLGVARLVMVEGKRSVPRAQRASSKQARFERIIVEAMRQCGRGDRMALSGPVPWWQQVEQPGAVVRWVLHPDAAAVPLLDALAQLPPQEALGLGAPELQLWVGPEGGFSDDELARLGDQGATLVRLGPLVQRTETAALAAVSAIGAWADARGCWQTGPFERRLVR